MNYYKNPNISKPFDKKNMFAQENSCAKMSGNEITQKTL
jgi:hypothetical protein